MIVVCTAALIALSEHASAENDVGPEASVRLAGLSSKNTLVIFDSGSPASATVVPITGTSARLLGIDVRPADQKLYALSEGNDLFTIDTKSGAAALVSTLTVPFDGAERGGFDFNPQAARLLLESSSGQNLRVHADLGATPVDGSLAFAGNDANRGVRPTVSAVAYTRSVRSAPSTKTFGIDVALDALVFQDPPNDGTLVTIGVLGVDFGATAGFDIASDASGGDRAFAVSGARLFGIDLESGRASALGTVGDGAFALLGLAVLPADSAVPPSNQGGVP